MRVTMAKYDEIGIDYNENRWPDSYILHRLSEHRYFARTMALSIEGVQHSEKVMDKL